jgi:lipopolysaccharide biosynthesis regulator YciM
LDFFIEAQTKIEWPQARGFNDISQEDMSLVHRLVKDVMKDKNSYRCKSCGFSGNQLHWQCPQCHQWDTIRRLRGPEGD